MAIEVTGLGVSVDTTAVKAATAAIRELIDVGTKAEQVLGNIGRNATTALGGYSNVVQTVVNHITQLGIHAQQTNTQVNVLNASLRQTQNISSRISAGGGGGGGGGGLVGLFQFGASTYVLKEMVENLLAAADTMQLMEAKIRNATKSQDDFNYATAAVKEIANDVHQPLDSIATLYARISRSAQDMGASQQQIKTITLATADALRISGATTAETTAAMLQLSQAFNKGKLDGDEFRSQMENNPRLMRAVADGMGLPLGALKELSKQGKLTMDVVSEAIIKQADTLRTESRDMGTTVGQAFTDVKNSLMEMTGETNKSTGATADLVKHLEDLATYLKSDEFKSTLTVAIGLLATLAKGVADSVEGLARLSQYAAFKQTGYVDPGSKDRDMYFNELVGKRQGLLDQKSELESEGAQNSWSYKDVISQLDTITKQLKNAQTAREDFDKSAMQAQRDRELSAGADDFIGSIVGDSLKSTYVTKAKKKRVPSDRTGKLADQYSLNSFDEQDDSPLNKYRDAILKISEAREADIKSGRSETEVNANAQKAVLGALGVYKQQEDQLKNRSKSAIDAYAAAMDDGTQALQANMDAQVARISMGDREYDKQQQINELYREEAKALKDLAVELQKHNDDGKGGIDQTTYDADVAKLKETTDRRVAIIQDGYDRMDSAERDWRNGVMRGLDLIQAKARDVAGQMADVISNAADGMADSITQFVMTGKASFGDFVKSVISDLVKIEARVIASQVLTSIIGMFMGGGSATGAGDALNGGSSYMGSGSLSTSWGGMGGGWGGANANAKGGVYSSPDLSSFSGTVVSQPTFFRAFANGGNVMGEAGPEGIFPLTKLPDGRLGITASGAGGGGAVFQINSSITINADGTSSQDSKTAANDSDFASKLSDMLTTKTRDELNRAMEPGGMIWNYLNGRR